MVCGVGNGKVWWGLFGRGWGFLISEGGRVVSGCDGY